LVRREEVVVCPRIEDGGGSDEVDVTERMWKQFNQAQIK
jgi:hypothetical protein